MNQEYASKQTKQKMAMMLLFVFGLFSLSLLILAAPVFAQNSKPTEEMSDSYRKLCSELNKIDSPNAKDQHKKYCGSKTPDTVSAMNKAANKICDDYGSNRLKEECSDYRSKNDDPGSNPLVVSDVEGKPKYQCGKGEDAVKTKFNFGCVGNNYSGSTLNPILDLIYAVIKFLSAGVGIVVIASVIWAGIQYSSSQGNPEQTQQAKLRIQNSVIGLILYLFIFALIQYLVPGGLFA